MPVRTVVNAMLRGINDPPAAPGRRLVAYYLFLTAAAAGLTVVVPEASEFLRAGRFGAGDTGPRFTPLFEIGRASCRERV